MSTDVQELIGDLDAGVFQEKLSRFLSAVASNVHDFERKGEITIKLKLQRMGSSNQLNCEHQVSYKHPTLRGDKTETDVTNTPLYVGTGGKLSLYPEKQDDMFVGDEKRPQPGKPALVKQQ